MNMPSPEPNKGMEDLLRAYANRRREQGRQELPSELPATSRTLLQDEVRRKFGVAKLPAWRWLASYWPRLAIGAGVAAVLIVVVIARVPPTETRSVAAAWKKLDDVRAKSLGQQFVQVNALGQSQNGGRSQAAVLVNFQIQRQGRNVLIYDGDGSVYRGNVLEPALAEDEKGSRSSRGAARPAGGEVNDAAKYSFQVSGINNNLKQNVVFTGNVLQMPGPIMVEGHAANRPPGAAPISATLPGGSNQKSTPSNPIQAATFQSQVPQFLRVTGKVKVEGQLEFDIEAQPPGR
jgi:hypothetical protein